MATSPENSQKELLSGPEIWESWIEEGGPEIWEPSNEDCGPEIFGNNTETNEDNIKWIVGKEKQEFELNRLICARASPEFAKIIKEQPSRENSYTIPDVSPKQFQNIVDQSEWTFTNLNSAVKLIDVAGKFQLLELQQKIFNELRKQIEGKRQLFDETSAFKAYKTFRRFKRDERGLAEAARQFILKNASELLEQDGSLRLSAPNLTEILNDDDLAVESELQVFKFVIKWGVHGIKSEKKFYTPEYFQDVLGPVVDVIRLPCLSEVEFQKYVLPMNILPANLVERRQSQQNQHVKQRKYLKNNGQMDPMIQMVNAALETVKAEQYLSDFKLQMQYYNSDLENQRLRKKIKCLEKELLGYKAENLQKQRNAKEEIKIKNNANNVSPSDSGSSEEFLTLSPDGTASKKATNDQKPLVQPELKVGSARKAPQPPKIIASRIKLRPSNFEQNVSPKPEKQKNFFQRIGKRLPGGKNGSNRKDTSFNKSEIQAVMSLEDAKRIASVQQVSTPKEEIQANVFSPAELSILRKSSSPTLCFFITACKIYVNVISGDLSNPLQGPIRIFEPIQKFTHYYRDAGDQYKPVEDTFNILKLLKQTWLARIRHYEVLPEEIIREYFLLLSQNISQEFDNPIRDHIVIHPAIFSERQVQRLKSATACIQHCRIINLQTILELSLTKRVGDLFEDLGVSKKALILHCTEKHFQATVASVTRSRTQILSLKGDQNLLTGSPDTIMFASRHQQFCEAISRHEDYALEDKIKIEAGEFYEKFIIEAKSEAGVKSIDIVLFVVDDRICGLRKYFNNFVAVLENSEIEEVLESNLLRFNGFKEAVLKFPF